MLDVQGVTNRLIESIESTRKGIPSSGALSNGASGEAASMVELSDEALVARTLGGDREAFGALYDRYQPLVYRIVLSRLGDPDVACDVVQEAFLAAWRSMDRLRQPRAFGSWIRRIAANLCANERRKPILQKGAMQSIEDLPVSPLAPSTNPVEEMDNQKRRSALEGAVAKLPEKYREVIELHYIRDCSCEITARFLGLTTVTVRARLHRARRMIVEILEQEGLL